MTTPFIELDYGFQYGDAKITRIHSDAKRGYVWIELATRKQSLGLYVTRTGKVRVYSNGVEWLPSKPKRKARKTGGRR